MPKQGLELYGLNWPPGMSHINVIRACVRKGGQWKDEEGDTLGAPLFDLYREFQTLLWGDRCQHNDWSDLILKTILEERVTTVLAAKDSGKTHVMARYALCDYFFFPKETLILMSSTDLRGLELRVYGEVKDLFVAAKEVWPDAPGFPVDSMHGIFSDELREGDDVRDIRKGLICLPVLDSTGQWKGMAKWVGVKQKRRRVLADELQFYPAPYLATLANLNKGDFKFVGVGNPIGEGEPLDRISEPTVGWDGLPEITTTTTWRNKMGGVTINLYGPDSPAIRFPGQFTYLINQADIDRIVDYWGKESAEYWNQAAGVRKPGINERRVVTRDMVRQFGAQDIVTWGGKQTVKGYAIDASYGGDRCVGGSFECGTDINGLNVVSFGTPTIIPIRVYPKSVPMEQRIIPEDQIAEFVKAECERTNIPASNVYFDATGRGSLGTSFARIWRADVNPIDFGGNPTPRPVTSDMYIYDEKLRAKRLKRCDEHYSKFVSELWFSVRYLIEGKQCRNLSNEAVDELCAREWGRAKGYKIEVEIKEETKKRIGKSPDVADQTAIACEGARRLGFALVRLESEKAKKLDEKWKDDLIARARKLKASYTLQQV